MATVGGRTAVRSGQGLLGIYLNDHLAGATAGLGLARRLAGAHRGSPEGEVLTRIAAEVAEDRVALLDIMAGLAVPLRQYKVYGAWALEKVGRLKLNGHLLSRSPLSALVELEALRLAAEGKAAGWRTLRARTAIDPRIDARRLDDLLTRARWQADSLEKLRVQTAARLFGSTRADTPPDAA